MSYTPEQWSEKRQWADWINTVLERGDISASELARRVGVCREAMSKWRCHEKASMPTPANREKLIQAAQAMGLV